MDYYESIQRFSLLLESKSSGECYVALREKHSSGERLKGWIAKDRGMESIRKKVEGLIERTRKKKFPDKPSRLNSIFVAPDITSVEVWSEMMGYPLIHKCKYSGNTHVTDGSIYTDIFSASVAKTGQAGSLIRTYWEDHSKDIGESLPLEMLVDGSVVIDEFVKEHKELQEDSEVDEKTKKFYQKIMSGQI